MSVVKELSEREQWGLEWLLGITKPLHRWGNCALTGINPILAREGELLKAAQQINGRTGLTYNNMKNDEPQKDDSSYLDLNHL